MFKELKSKLEKAGVTLVAVSKTKPPERIKEVYDTGQLDFGENRVQEFLEKSESLPEDIRWHLIGHLQRNKVKYIIGKVHLIHSVDSPRLLKEINKEGEKEDKITNCLLQIKIAEEDSKYGLSPKDAEELLRSEAYQKMAHVRICGVMGMATFTDDSEQVRQEFDRLNDCFQHLKASFFSDDEHFKEISMGMSGDYEIGIEAGSTMVRIGSLIFGERN